MIILPGEPMSKITEHVYVGTYGSASSLDDRNPEDIQCILNCTKQPHEDLSGFEVNQLNISDGEPIDPKVLRFAIDCIYAAWDANKKILVHCHAGLSRSPSIVIAYLMDKHGYLWDEAFEIVRSRRPNIMPHPAIIMSIKKVFQGTISLDTTMFRKEE